MILEKYLESLNSKQKAYVNLNLPNPKKWRISSWGFPFNPRQRIKYFTSIYRNCG